QILVAANAYTRAVVDQVPVALVRLCRRVAAVLGRDALIARVGATVNLDPGRHLRQRRRRQRAGWSNRSSEQLSLQLHDFSLSLVVIRLGSAANGRIAVGELYLLRGFTGKFAVAPAQRPVSLLGKDPLHQRPEVGIGDGGVGRHRNLPPHALAALFHLVDQLGFGRLVAAVLGGDFLVGRAD